MKVAIIGAGISGLACAADGHRAVRKGSEWAIVKLCTGNK